LSLQAYHEATEWIRVSAPGFRRERAGARPAANRQTMIVEGQGMGFWTRVRLPSSPLKLNKSNSVYDIIVYRNMFCLVYRRK